MVLAIVATWVQPGIVHHGWIVIAIVAGFAVGVPLSRVPLTAVPQRTAISHAFGGLAAGLVGTAKYCLWASEGPEHLTPFRMAALVVEVILGFLTFTRQLDGGGQAAGNQVDSAAAGAPIPCQNVTNIGLLALAVADRDRLGRGIRRHPGRVCCFRR